MENLYTNKKFEDAKLVASLAHRNQVYDEIYPYMKHINDVLDVLVRFGFGNKYLIAGALHDTLEDCNLSYNKIKKHFGLEVAEMVYCVTDLEGRNRLEKKLNSLPRTASNPDAIIIKLADRIANIEHGGKIDMYAKEYQQFRDFLFGKSLESAKHMWEYLDSKLLIENK